MHISSVAPIALLLASGLLTSPSSAQTTLVHELMSIQDLRERLANYEPAELPEVVSDLTAMLEPGASMAVRDEARWLRAAAAVDAIIVGAGNGDDDYQGSLARAYQVDNAQLRSAIRVDLEYLSRGVFEGPAQAALMSLEATGPSAQAGAGLGADALWLQELSADLQRDEPAQSVLRRHFDRVSTPPSLEGLAYASVLPPSAQAAVRTLMGAAEAYQRFELALVEGAPVTRHLEAPVAAAWDVIRNVEIRPAYSLSSTHRVTRVNQTNVSALSRPEILVYLRQDAISYAIAPVIGVNADGAVALRETSHPTYPTMQDLALPRSIARAAVPLAAVANLLQRSGLPSGDWALAVEPSVNSLLLAQTLIAAKATPDREVRLLGRSPSGATLSVPIGLLPAATEGLPRSQVRITVARRGYHVHSIWGSAQLPTVLRNGRMSHDRDRLDRTLEPFAIRSAMLRFQDNVRAEAVTDAIWSIAPEDGPVLLLAESSRLD